MVTLLQHISPPQHNNILTSYLNTSTSQHYLLNPADFDNATKGKHLDIKTYTESMGEDYEYFLSLMLALAIGMAALLTINRAPLFFKLARLKKNNLCRK